MSGVIDSLFGITVPHGRLLECIAGLEEALGALRETPYHAILGKDFLHLSEAAAGYIADVYRRASLESNVKAMYCEMNGFEINPDLWYFNGFTYDIEGDLWDLTFDPDWLADWNYAEEDGFVLTGLEQVQDAFARLYCDASQPLSVRLAGELAEHLVIARFNELIGAAHGEAKIISPDLETIPIFSTAHDWDMIYPST